MKRGHIILLFLYVVIAIVILSIFFIKHLKSSARQLKDIQYALDESSTVSITDSQGIITYVNDSFCEITQYDKNELVGQNHRIMNSGYHSKQFYSELWNTIINGKVWKGEIRNMTYALRVINW
jgi:two-component system sensor histidine kinase NreB